MFKVVGKLKKVKVAVKERNRCENNFNYNIFIVYKILYFMNMRNRKKSGMEVKLDMEKVYDMMELNFLFKVLERLGFYGIWI